MNDRGKVDLTKSRTLSFKMFNLAEIPVINLNNQILVGHMRIAILIELGRGDELIDVRVPNKQLSK
jgi:site-specific DNA-methyltransferase (adenine-specific)